MKQTLSENIYNKLYGCSINEVERNLDEFIKEKEKIYFQKYNR